MKNTSKEFWGKVSKEWKYLKPPFRPSPPELTIYENIIKKIATIKKSPTAVILGATPELRDLLAKYKYANVALIDIDENVIKEMNRLLMLSDGKEDVYVCNWLDMVLPNKYDLVLCDHGLHFIPFPDWKRFFLKVAEQLSDDGKFVISIFTKPDNKNINIEVLLNEFKSNPQWTDEDSVYFAYHLFFNLMMNNFADLDKIVLKLKEKGIDDNLISKMFPLENWEHKKSYIAENLLTKKIINQVFNIESINIPRWHHPVYSFHQIHILMRKID